MKSSLFIALVVLLSFGNAQAQLPNGSIAPDFTLVDLNGTELFALGTIHSPYIKPLILFFLTLL